MATMPLTEPIGADGVAELRAENDRHRRLLLQLRTLLLTVSADLTQADWRDLGPHRLTLETVQARDQELAHKVDLALEAIGRGGGGPP
jgi:hypothetical protein